MYEVNCTENKDYFFILKPLKKYVNMCYFALESLENLGNFIISANGSQKTTEKHQVKSYTMRLPRCCLQKAVREQEDRPCQPQHVRLQNIRGQQKSLAASKRLLCDFASYQ